MSTQPPPSQQFPSFPPSQNSAIPEQSQPDFGNQWGPSQQAKSPFFKKWWFWLLIGLLLIAGGVIGGLQANSSSTSSSTPATSQSPEPTESAITVETEPPTPPSEAPQPTVEPPESTPEPASNVPAEYQSALDSAKSYSDIFHMSKAGLFDQLTSEYGDGFSAEAAQYAVDNLDVRLEAERPNERRLI